MEVTGDRGGNRNDGLEDVPCPSCGRVGTVRLTTERAPVTVRELTVEVDQIFRRCDACGHEYENSRDPEWRHAAFDLYRRERNFLFPDEIRQWRKTLDLTQEELTALLGWGEVTLGRYERGSLPSETHNGHLRTVMEPSVLLERLREKPDAISADKRAALLEKLRPAAIRQQAKSMILVLAGGSFSRERTGNRSFHYDRFANTVKALTANNAEYKTKLNKLLFYVDFGCFRDLGESVTGLRYARINRGPVPQDFAQLLPLLEKSGEILIDEGEYGDCIRPCGEVDWSLFSPEEHAAILAVREKFRAFTATAISDYSHRERAWQEVENGRLIPYSYSETLLLDPIPRP